MPRFYFVPPSSTQIALRVMPSEDYIEFDDIVTTTNAHDAFAQAREEAPPLLEQWRAKYDFHVMMFRCLLSRSPGARGVKQFKIEAKIKGGRGSSVQVQDIGPKTQWVEGRKSLDVEIGLGLDVIGALLTFAQLPSIPLQGKVVFRYMWQSKVAQVISGCAGRHMKWEFNATHGQYLEGSHILMAILRRHRGVKNLSLQLVDARAHHDVFGEDRVYVDPGKLIRVEFNESERSES